MLRYANFGFYSARGLVKLDLVALILPILFLTLSLTDLLFHPEFSGRQTVGLRFISNIIFLNWIHVFFTLALLATLPELKQWMKAKQNKLSLSLPLYWCLIFFVLSLAEYLCIIEAGNFEVFFFLEVPIYLWTLIHFSSQSFGISLLHSRNLSASNLLISKSWLARSSRIERLMIISVSILSTITFALHHVQSVEWILKFNRLYVLETLSGLMVISYIVTLFRVENPIRYTKMLFSARYLLYPLLAHSLFATLGLAASHGVEYLLVCRKMIKSSQQTQNWKPGSFATGTFICILGLGLSLLGHRAGLLGLITAGKQPVSFTYTLYYALFSGVGLFHYYLDGIIFRFKDRCARDFIAPTLASPQHSGNHSELAKVSNE